MSPSDVEAAVLNADLMCKRALARGADGAEVDRLRAKLSASTGLDDTQRLALAREVSEGARALLGSQVMRLRCAADDGTDPAVHLAVDVRLPLSLGILHDAAKLLGRCVCGAEMLTGGRRS
jgi:hypothetical protein